MTATTVAILLLLVVTGLLFLHWLVTATNHGRRIERLQVRVHVNGIRGKSSVTRLIAGMLREGGYVTVAKTTGSAARVIDSQGRETAIRRRGAATINEQLDVVRRQVGPGVEALVIECMAVRPLYQAYAQDFMVRSDITVITNVREDHQEEMGETLEEIADSMSVTIPRHGVLVTAEDRPHLRERLAAHARARDSRFIHADPATVLDEDLRGFGHLEFKENVAIGLAVARLLGIDRDTALAGMWKAVPDVGAIRLRTYDLLGKQVLWVPLFAANDRESVVADLDLLRPHFPAGATVVALLNNRSDRGRRAELFAHLVCEDLRTQLDQVVTLGAFEEPVTSALVAGGWPAERVHNFGDTRQPSLEDLLVGIAGLIQGPTGVLIGLVNIHTAQAELLLQHFASLRPPDDLDDDGIQLSHDPARLPETSRRLLRARSHPGGGSRA